MIKYAYAKYQESIQTLDNQYVWHFLGKRLWQWCPRKVSLPILPFKNEIKAAEWEFWIDQNRLKGVYRKDGQKDIISCRKKKNEKIKHAVCGRAYFNMQLMTISAVVKCNLQL